MQGALLPRYYLRHWAPAQRLRPPVRKLVVTISKPILSLEGRPGIPLPIVTRQLRARWTKVQWATPRL